MIRVHHQQAIIDLVASIVADGSFQAVILSGSIAKGTATEQSDLDVYLVVPPDEYARRRARHDLAYNAACDYPGGYVDGKLISVEALHAAAERGSEPMRASFIGSKVVHSTIGDLQPLIERIAIYPEQNRTRNMRDFFSHVVIHATYFGPQAIDRDDPFLLSHAVSSMVLFAGRLVLAYNRILYPCPKQLLATVASARHQPEGFMERTQALLREPTAAAMLEYKELVAAFSDWGLPDAEILSVFMELDEWSWIEHEPALAQR